ncbi:MAG: SgcJ/EcaC family oxidoreductase, partial [Gemmataceae bacterium]
DANRKCYNGGDIKGVLAYWADDADYIDTSGTSHKGREAIGKLFRAASENMKDTTMKVSITALKFLKQDVALEDGVITFTGPNGSKESSRYSAVWVKNEGKWQISSARDLGDGGSVTSAADRLAGLDWLIGTWQAEGPRGAVSVNARWAPGKSFVIIETTAKRKEGQPQVVTQWVGWDPQQRAIHSWFFDSQGGFGQGYWYQQDGQWLSDVNGMLPDGREGTATLGWKKIDDKTIQWSSRGREIDGQPVPDVEVKFTKVDDRK